jgi:hypothetical protein
MPPKFRHWKMLFIVRQQDSIMVNRDGCNGGIGKRKRLPSPSPMKKQGARLLGDCARDIVIRELVEPVGGKFFFALPHSREESH